MTEELVQRLRNQINRFAPIPDEDWEKVLPHLRLGEVKRNQAFSEEGKRADKVGLVIDGMFRQFYTVDGEEKTTWFFFPNDLLCSYISCITGKPSQITIQAITPATYLYFPYAVAEELYTKSLPWLNFGRRIAEYVAIGLEERMVGLLTLKPEERYRLLLQKNPQLLEKVTLQYIANFLGITPVSMSRIRSRFSKK